MTSVASCSVLNSSFSLCRLFRKAFVSFSDGKSSKNPFLISGMFVRRHVSALVMMTICLVFLSVGLLKFCVLLLDDNLFLLRDLCTCHIPVQFSTIFSKEAILFSMQPWFPSHHRRRVSPRSSRFSETASQSQFADVRLRYLWLYQRSFSYLLWLVEATFSVCE